MSAPRGWCREGRRAIVRRATRMEGRTVAICVGLVVMYMYEYESPSLSPFLHGVRARHVHAPSISARIAL